MEERRRIIIPTGAQPDRSLRSPHFDSEATLLARPVVPLEQVYQPPRTKLLVALLVFMALLVGAAGAMAFDYFRNKSQQQQEAPIVKQQQQSVPAAPAVHTSQQSEQPPPQVSAAQPKVQEREQPTVETKPKPTPDDQAASGNGTWDENGPSVTPDERAGKKAKTEHRRRQDDQYSPEEVHRQVERAGREINRIREIFEGPQQP